MKLPLLVSVPHGGLGVPAQLADRCLLTPDEIAADGDVGAAEIYAIADRVEAFVTTPVARAVLDMNRAEDDRSKDGVVKTHTCWDVPVWREPLPEDAIEALFREHHRPYHSQLTRPSARVVLGVDAHTMAAYGPPVGPDPGSERPRACLSNADGTCPRAWIEHLRDLLASTLGDPVTINHPFRGGYITRTHGRERPWMQLELSRAPFASTDEKRHAVTTALERWCDRFGAVDCQRE